MKFMVYVGVHEKIFWMVSSRKVLMRKILQQILKKKGFLLWVEEHRTRHQSGMNHK